MLCAIWFSGTATRRRWRRDLLLGYVAGVTFFWSVFSWLTTVTVPGWILVGAYMAIYPALWAWLCGRLRPGPGKAKEARGLDAVTQRVAALRQQKEMPQAPSGAELHNRPRPDTLERVPANYSPWLGSLHNLRLALLVASAWVTVESLRATVFSGWGWNTLGSALHAQWAMIQIVEFTGVPGLSFLVAFTNVILLATVRRFILETKVKPVRPHYDLTLTMAAILGVAGFGLRAVQMRQESQVVRVSAVQPNIPREQKFHRAFVQATFDTFTRLSQLALPSRPDLLVWPESSMPGPVMHDEESYRFVMDFSAASKVDLLLGAIDQDEKAAYNAALLVSEGGDRVQLYRKVHLVPFGEYVPGRHTLPGLARIVGDQVPDDFGFGKEHTVFRLTAKDVQIAPLICFEDTIGELTRKFVLGGANLLANVTNDGWFKLTSGSRQHLANAVFRCVETRRPMVRSANTGVTCFINEFGRVTQVLLDENGSQFTEGVLSGDLRVPVARNLTFYVRHGELFATVCAYVTGLTVLFIVWRRVRRPESAAAPGSE